MKDRRKKLRQGAMWLNLSAVGLQFPIAIGLGYGAGYYLDGLFGSKPYLTVVFSIFGVAAGFLNLFRMTAQVTRQEEQEMKRLAEEQRLADGDVQDGDDGDGRGTGGAGA